VVRKSDEPFLEPERATEIGCANGTQTLKSEYKTFLPASREPGDYEIYRIKTRLVARPAA
jgi:hypothetical protein